jgi:hypothetical protein
VLWIHIGFNADPEPDPAFNLIADLDPRELNPDTQKTKNMSILNLKKIYIL